MTRASTTRNQTTEKEGETIMEGNQAFQDLRNFFLRHRELTLLKDEVDVAEKLLCNCWQLFEGSDEGGMEAYKLLNRTEGMQWKTPTLTFNIERHGATVGGSVYAEIQSWTVDFERRTARVEPRGRREVKEKAKVVKTLPLAEDVAKLILERSEDPRLVWKTDTKVRIDIQNVVPTTNQQTTSSRRKRFRANLQEILTGHGWRMTTMNTFERGQ